MSCAPTRRAPSCRSRRGRRATGQGPSGSSTWFLLQPPVPPPASLIMQPERPHGIPGTEALGARRRSEVLGHLLVYEALSVSGAVLLFTRLNIRLSTCTGNQQAGWTRQHDRWNVSQINGGYFTFSSGGKTQREKDLEGDRIIPRSNKKALEVNLSKSD